MRYVVSGCLLLALLGLPGGAWSQGTGGGPEAPGFLVVATRNLPINHAIGPEDVREEAFTGSPADFDPHVTLEEVLGKRVWRPVSRGTALKSWNVRTVDNVERGDQVLIVAERGVIRVEAPGRALDNGEFGQTIRVMSLVSGKVLEATVVDTQTVSVPF